MNERTFRYRASTESRKKNVRPARYFVTPTSEDNCRYNKYCLLPSNARPQQRLASASTAGDNRRRRLYRAYWFYPSSKLFSLVGPGSGV